MAAVLDAFAPYVKKLIADMAQEEVSMLLGVSSEITKLEDNMEGLRAFLGDAERRRITDTSVQRWTTKLRNAMYDATDILDLCQLEANKRRESRGGGSEEHKSLSCFQPLLFCLRNPRFAHKIGSRIKELNQRLEVIHKEADKYKFNIGLGSNPEPRKLFSAELSSYRTSSHIDESKIVGEQIERDTKELIQVLTTDADNNHNIKVVSIIGAGGMGKTTLAQKIFNDPTIQEHFKMKTIWLSITQHFDEVELLKTAIKHGGGDHGDEKVKSTLTGALINTLSTGRFLLVMDDVWSPEAWNHVLCVPIKNASKKQPGSRVLVTTRSAHLPQQMQAPLHQHRVRPLENDDAWSLLKKQLQPEQMLCFAPDIHRCSAFATKNAEHLTDPSNNAERNRHGNYSAEKDAEHLTEGYVEAGKKGSLQQARLHGSFFSIISHQVRHACCVCVYKKPCCEIPEFIQGRKEL